MEILRRIAQEPGEIQDSCERVRFIASYLRGFTGVDPRLFTRAMIDAAKGPIDNTLASLSGFESTRDMNHLRNAVTHSESALEVAGRWPEGTARGGAAAKAKATFEAYASELSTTIASERETASQFIHNLYQQKQSLEQAIAQLQEEAQRLSVELGERRAQTERLSIESDTLLSSQKDSFSLEIKSRGVQLQEWLNSHESDFQSIARPHVESLESAAARGAEVVAKIAELHAQAEKVASVATSTILARDYGSYARREWWSGVISYVAGFGAAIATAVMLWRALGVVGISDKVSWQFVSLKVGLGATMLAAASVAFQLGSRFLSRAALNKRIELELRALGPFLADVSDDDAVRKAKLDFVAKTFGNVWSTESDDRAPRKVDVKAVTPLVEAIAKAVSGRP
jgi:hypothetical protein